MHLTNVLILYIYIWKHEQHNKLGMTKELDHNLKKEKETEWYYMHFYHIKKHPMYIIYTFIYTS